LCLHVDTKLSSATLTTWGLLRDNLILIGARQEQSLIGGFRDTDGTIISGISAPQSRAVSYCTLVIAAKRRTDRPRTPRREKSRCVHDSIKRRMAHRAPDRRIASTENIAVIISLTLIVWLQHIDPNGG
jgi:hypothetical protein